MPRISNTPAQLPEKMSRVNKSIDHFIAKRSYCQEKNRRAGSGAALQKNEKKPAKSIDLAAQL
jgi:hypothetical protein